METIAGKDSDNMPRVSAPAGIASGQRDPARITVTQTLANRPPVIRTDSVTYTTTAGAAGLKLT